MSGAISSHGGLTRRSFLKATGAVAGAAAVTGVATPTLQALAADYESGQKRASRNGSSAEYAVPTVSRSAT